MGAETENESIVAVGWMSVRPSVRRPSATEDIDSEWLGRSNSVGFFPAGKKGCERKQKKKRRKEKGLRIVNCAMLEGRCGIVKVTDSGLG